MVGDGGPAMDLQACQDIPATAWTICVDEIEHARRCFDVREPPERRGRDRRRSPTILIAPTTAVWRVSAWRSICHAAGGASLRAGKVQLQDRGP